jgi:hypothetical protein
MALPFFKALKFHQRGAARTARPMNSLVEKAPPQSSLKFERAQEQRLT